MYLFLAGKYDIISRMKDHISRFLDFREESFFLFGPRGTGKTTWLNDHLGDALSINLLESDAYLKYSANPMHLRDVVEGCSSQTFIIDEIQKVPSLLDVVHDLIEKHPDRRFILTGSSARKLKRTTGVNLLGGRALEVHMHPFMAAELGERFSLDEALMYGTLPVILKYKDKAAALASYLNLYIREEVQMEGLVRNLDSFARFLESASFSHGAMLSATDISRECGVKRTTVDGFVEILEGLLIASRLPPFLRHAKRRLVARDKFYFFDAGVYRCLRPKGVMDRPEEIAGMALEGLVYQHLAAWRDYSGVQGGLYFWRTHQNHEVDFVVYTEYEFAAIEVKHTRNPSRSDFAGLKLFAADYPVARRILLYRGNEQYLEDGVLVVPVERFLVSLKPGHLLSDMFVKA